MAVLELPRRVVTSLIIIHRILPKSRTHILGTVTPAILKSERIGVTLMVANWSRCYNTFENPLIRDAEGKYRSCAVVTTLR